MHFIGNLKYEKTSLKIGLNSEKTMDSTIVIAAMYSKNKKYLFGVSACHKEGLVPMCQYLEEPFSTWHVHNRNIGVHFDNYYELLL